QRQAGGGDRELAYLRSEARCCQPRRGEGGEVEALDPDRRKRGDVRGEEPGGSYLCRELGELPTDVAHAVGCDHIGGELAADREREHLAPAGAAREGGIDGPQSRRPDPSSPGGGRGRR